MTLYTPLYMQAGGGDTPFDVSAQLDRQLFMALFRTEGVAPPIGANALLTSGFKVTQRAAGANFSVDISVGIGIVDGDDVANQGRYMVWSDAVENVAIPTPAAGTRTHRVVAQVRDKLHNGAWSTYDWTFLAVPDTTGVLPALPATALELAQVPVAPSDTAVFNSAIVDKRTLASLGMPRFPHVSSNAGRPPVPAESEMWWRTDQKYYELWNGSGYDQLTPRPEPVNTTNTDAGTTTSTGGTETLTGAGTNPSLPFTAPASGKVMLRYGAFMRSNTSFNDVMFGARVKVTSGGATFYTTTDSQMAKVDVTNNVSAASECKVSGLTPGTSYTVVGWHKVDTSTTGTYDDRYIVVDPI